MRILASDAEEYVATSTVQGEIACTASNKFLNHTSVVYVTSPGTLCSQSGKP